MKEKLRIRRALLTVSDKRGIVELARALSEAGAEIVATGRTARVVMDAGIRVRPIESVSGSPEAFRGRMKTLSFPVCSGILYRRGDMDDEKDLELLKIAPIDCVVVNFYPFEDAAKRAASGGLSRKELVEEIDIGGPALVRAAAKNSPDVLVLTDASQYGAVTRELERDGAVARATCERAAAEAWDRILEYDLAVAREFGTGRAGGVSLAAPAASRGETAAAVAPPDGSRELKLRYGENPHQEGSLRYREGSPVAWGEPLTRNELSYNNILDLSAAWSLGAELAALSPEATGVVIVKHNNPCGVALVPRSVPGAQKAALTRAWEGDPVSAFGGVILFTDAIEDETAAWLSERFIECVAAPRLTETSRALDTLAKKRKKLKAVRVESFEIPSDPWRLTVPGGELVQSPDAGTAETLKSVTRAAFPEEAWGLGRFGIAVCRSLKSNAIAVVREIPGMAGAYQLAGAGQGQPNRVEALGKLALPRAQATLQAASGKIGDCVLVSDAFFPFRDSIDAAHAGGIRYVIQPGGSMRDSEVIEACDEYGIAMAFTGTRHFRH